MRDTIAALVLGVGLSLNNARAVWEALGRDVGVFERTPKSGFSSSQLAPAAAGRSRTLRRIGIGRAEVTLALYFLALLAWAGLTGQFRAVPFLLLLTVGYAWVGNATARRTSDGP